LVVVELGCRLAKGTLGLQQEWNLADTPDPGHWSIHDPLLGFVPKPGSVSWHGSFGDDGFRLAPGATPAKPGLVVATRDSFTLGEEAADDGAWPAILQELTGVRVINAGVNAYGIDQTVVRTERLAATVAPTAMVVSFIADDIRRTEMRRVWGMDEPYFVIDGNLLVLNPVVEPTAEDVSASPLSDLLRQSAVARVAIRGLAALDDWTYSSSEWRQCASASPRFGREGFVRPDASRRNAGTVRAVGLSRGRTWALSSSTPPHHVKRKPTRTACTVDGPPRAACQPANSATPSATPRSADRPNSRESRAIDADVAVNGGAWTNAA
jgi:hypothetical protein